MHLKYLLIEELDAMELHVSVVLCIAVWNDAESKDHCSKRADVGTASAFQNAQ